jgi:hypothetical protein
MHALKRNFVGLIRDLTVIRNDWVQFGSPGQRQDQQLGFIRNFVGLTRGLTVIRNDCYQLLKFSSPIGRYCRQLKRL